MPQGEMTLDSAHILRSKRRNDSRLKETFVYDVEPSLPLNLLSPLRCLLWVFTPLEHRPLEWSHLQHKGHKMLTAYLILLTQLVNARGLDVNHYTDSILAVL